MTIALPAQPARRVGLWIGLGLFGVSIAVGVAAALLILPRGPHVASRGSGTASDVATEVTDGSRRALLIGVNKYGRNSSLSDLQFPVADVEELGTVLRGAGYEVTLLATGGTEPTRDAIRAAFRSVKDRWKEGDTLVVAFAGHGTQWDKTFYFCPTDANFSDVSSLVSIDEMFDDMKACPGGFKLLLADACRDKPPELTRGRLVDGLESKTRPRQALPTPPNNVTAFYSCSNGEQAFEHPTLGHGVFFHYVIHGLRGAADFNGTGEVTVPKLQEYVQKEAASFVARKIGRRQKPAIETVSNDNRPIVSLKTATAPQLPPTPPLGGDVFWLDESFQRVPAGSLPAGWDAAAFAVARPEVGPPYLKAMRSAGRHYVQLIRNRNLGDAFFVECECCLGEAQALEIVLHGDGTPGASFLVRGDGVMAFPGSRPARPEAFRRGQRNRLRLLRVGDRFQVSVNDSGAGADCEFAGRIPRRLTGVALGYVAAGANQYAILNTSQPGFTVAGGNMAWPPSAVPSVPTTPPAGPADQGVYSVRVGPLDDTAEVRSSVKPPAVKTLKLDQDFTRMASLPTVWDAPDFAVTRDDGGRPALQITSAKSREFVATLQAPQFSNDFWLEFEFAAGQDGMRIELDCLRAPIKVPAASGGEDANRVQRLHLRRVASWFTVVADAKDADAQLFKDPDPSPLREIRVVMKGVRDTYTAAPRVYAIRGGELEPTTQAAMTAEPVPTPTQPRSVQVDFDKLRAGDSLDGWRVDGARTGVREMRGRRWLGLIESGKALVTVPPVNLVGDFTAEADFTVSRGGLFGMRFSELGASDEKLFEVSIDGSRSKLLARSLPALPFAEGNVTFRSNGPNTLRVVRTGDSIALEYNGAAARPVTGFPRVAFNAVQLLFADPSGTPTPPTAVLKLSVTPK